MPMEVIFVLIIGFVFIYFGLLIFTGKVPTLLDYFLKQGVTYHDKKSLKFFGTFIIIIGILVLFLPVILGVKNMNL
ncbi:hypothetical protein SAMN05216389_101268 [Oceanobacillus limi]|uniref:Uncharacterized protein n=1 Tax=Oceanobacillus limi TaxID=930131 RepID=A0A1H9Y9J4_9BACI|nr:hypothetical protein [Oceanobacillus limi]SES65454.1 hypothetical protein SAMN05216389_101268 [Oceanobacillus limi]